MYMRFIQSGPCELDHSAGAAEDPEGIMINSGWVKCTATLGCAQQSPVEVANGKYREKEMESYSAFSKHRVHAKIHAKIHALLL